MKHKKIKTISVKKLFGLYDYSLSIPLNVKDDLFILYGDNGTGKSTLLRLLYHLLSSELGQSHKTYLANVPFKSFEVSFIDGTIVRAARNNGRGEYIGQYCLELVDDSGPIKCQMPCEWSEEHHRYRVTFGILNGDSKKTFLSFLKRLGNFSVFYISDDRKIDSTRDSNDNRDRHSKMTDDPVNKELDYLQDWIVSQALEASKKGEEGTSEIYVKILSKLGSRRKNNESTLSYEGIFDEIDAIDSRAKSYALMGFISDANYSEVKSYLKKVLKGNREPAVEILLPYLEIQKKRLNALDNLFDTVQYFTSSLNKYLYKKKVLYSVTEGFKFYQRLSDDDPKPVDIDVSKLSSGERQLLRLFSMVIRNSNSCPIIIIDEPEISLNIKWQRLLLSTLSYFVRDTGVQFIIATHSFEILSSHIQNTVKIGDSYFPAGDDQL